jgi:hypothetical protein
MIKRRGTNQIGKLILDHKSFESKGQMRSNWSVLYNVGKIISKAIKYYVCTFEADSI